MNPIRILGALLIVLVACSMVAPATVMALSPAVVPVATETEPEPVRINVSALNISFDTAVDLALTIKKAMEPLYNWALVHLNGTNITIHEKMWKRGDYFLEKAYNLSETNETLATAYAFLASVFYSREILAAYIVIGITIKTYNENGTPTNTTVTELLARAEELRNMVENNPVVTEDNITLPEISKKLLNISAELAEESRKYLEEGMTGRALSYAVRSCHTAIRAYSALVRYIYAVKLGIKVGAPRFLTMLLGPSKEKAIERLKKVLARLPEPLRQRILERIKNARDLMEYRKAIREALRECRERMRHAGILAVARIATKVVWITAMMPTETGLAVRNWLRANGIHSPKELYDYVLPIVNETVHTYNVSGFKLLNITLNVLSDDIYNKTSVKVDLLHIFYTMLAVRIHVYAKHKAHEG